MPAGLSRISQGEPARPSLLALMDPRGQPARRRKQTIAEVLAATMPEPSSVMPATPELAAAGPPPDVGGVAMPEGLPAGVGAATPEVGKPPGLFERIAGGLKASLPWLGAGGQGAAAAASQSGFAGPMGGFGAGYSATAYDPAAELEMEIKRQGMYNDRAKAGREADKAEQDYRAGEAKITDTEVGTEGKRLSNSQLVPDAVSERENRESLMAARIIANVRNEAQTKNINAKTDALKDQAPYALANLKSAGEERRVRTESIRRIMESGKTEAEAKRLFADAERLRADADYTRGLTDLMGDETDIRRTNAETGARNADAGLIRANRPGRGPNMLNTIATLLKGKSSAIAELQATRAERFGGEAQKQAAIDAKADEYDTLIAQAQQQMGTAPDSRLSFTGPLRPAAGALPPGRSNMMDPGYINELLRENGLPPAGVR